MPKQKRTRARRSTKPKSKKTKVLTNRLNRFRLFPKLPWELRDMIWKDCVVPQVITIMNDSHESREQLDEGSSRRYYKTIVRAKAKFTTPAILHVSQESRVVGLKAWSLEFGPQLRHPVYFNWKRDTLFMDNFDALLAFYGGPWTHNTSFGNDMSNVEKSLRHLVIGEQIPSGFVPTKIISRLYNLEELKLPRLVGRGFVANKAQKELAEKIRGWMTAKQDLYSEQEGVYKDWMLPDVEFMSKKELADLDDMVEKYFQRSGFEVSPGAQEENGKKEKDEELSVEPRREYGSWHSQL